ncbi:MAG: hypothetical protein ACREYE_22755, partial [Gammaproteobacteria bacterium]
LGISRSGGARNPHVFQYTLRFLRSGGTRPSFARDGFFTNSQISTTNSAEAAFFHLHRSGRGIEKKRHPDEQWNN